MGWGWGQQSSAGVNKQLVGKSEIQEHFKKKAQKEELYTEIINAPYKCPWESFADWVNACNYALVLKYMLLRWCSPASLAGKGCPGDIGKWQQK